MGAFAFRNLVRSFTGLEAKEEDDVLDSFVQGFHGEREGVREFVALAYFFPGGSEVTLNIDIIDYLI